MIIGKFSLINRLSIVRKVPIFSKLKWLDIHKIARRSEIVEYKKGETIRKQEDPPDALYCLISGRVESYNQNENGGKHEVEFLHRGMYFGIISLLTGENHSRTFVAMNDSILLKIEKKDFQGILKNIPQLGVEFSQTLSRRIRRRDTRAKSSFERTIISIYAPLKGAGSSTYAVNLALTLERETRQKVILLNFNSVGKSSSSMPDNVVEAAPRWKENAINLKDIVGDDEKIRQSISRGEVKIDLLNVVIDPKDETLVNQISQFVSALVDDYNYVVVDLPNEKDDVVIKTLTQSDIIQLICLDREEDFRMIRQVIDELGEAMKENFRRDKIQVIVRGLESKSYLSFEDISKEIDFNIFTVLPHIDRTDLKQAVVSKDLTLILPEVHSEYAKAITRVARRIGGVLVGLVLGGGAALGVAHVGVIRVLEEENIPIDIVVGSSMGALLGSLWVVGNNAEQLERIAREFERKESLIKLMDPIFPVAGLVGGKAINHWLRGHLGDKTFYSTKIPLKVIAYDLIHRQEMVIDRGLLVDAVQKSISIPGVIRPVLEGDRVIIDGGVLNPLPTNVLTEMGIKKIIAVNVLQSPDDVSKGFIEEQKLMREEERIPFKKSPKKYISFRIGRFFSRMLTPNISDIIVRTLQASEYVISQQSALKADVLIHPDLKGINWFELYKVDDLIARGEKATREVLPQILKIIKE